MHHTTWHFFSKISGHGLHVPGDVTVLRHNFTFPCVPVVATCGFGSQRASSNGNHYSVQESFSMTAVYKRDVSSRRTYGMHIKVHVLEAATCTQPFSTARFLFPYLLSCEFPYALVELLLIKTNQLSRC